MVRTKSVWSPIHRGSDGVRILATRFRGRGMPPSRYDVWIKQLGRLGRVTLLCHCAEDQVQCHRHELSSVIRSNRV